MTAGVTRVAALAVLLAGLGGSTARAQMPEDRGSLTPAEWDAGNVSAAGTDIPTKVVYPEDGTGPFPLVGVIHGASRTGANHVELARTLASHGFVVVLPNIPCGFTGCNHDENAAQISALLEWAVTVSEDPTPPIAGLVDGSRRGLIGHSWGALASHIAASRDDTIDSVVLFDPNDDGTEGRDATPGITAPELQLLAEVPGSCNGAWREDMVSSMLPEPNLQITVSGSAHCDPEDPGDAFCPIACGSGDPDTSSIFRRYAMAWTTCILAADADAAPWLGGASMTADEGGGVIEGVVAAGLDELPCRGGGPITDAGTPPADGGTPSADAGTPPRTDGGSPGLDAGGSTDAGTTTGGDDDGGCGCHVPGARRSTAALPLAGAALLFVLARLRTRRRPTRRHPPAPPRPCRGPGTT